MKNLQSFLKLNGKIIVFLSKNGTYWIAIRPICEALNVNYNRQFQNLKKDPIFGAKFAKQQIQVPGDQLRFYICLPERYIYGWLLTINSESPELLEYKVRCYDILYDHFHGTLTKRHEILNERIEIKAKIEELSTGLSVNPDYSELNNLKAKNMRIEKDLKKLDEDLLNGQKLLNFNN